MIFSRLIYKFFFECLKIIGGAVLWLILFLMKWLIKPFYFWKKKKWLVKKHVPKNQNP